MNLPEVNYFEGMKLFDANSQLTSISLPKLKTITMISHLATTRDGIFDSNSVESINLPELSTIIFNSNKPNQPSELYIYDQNIKLRHIYLPSLTSIEGEVYNNIDITDMGNISFSILGDSAGETIKDEDDNTIYSPLEAIDIPNLTTVNIQYINMQTNAVSYKPVTIIDSTSGSLMYLKRINLRNFGGTLAFSSTTESVVCLSSGSAGLSALEVLDLGCSNIKNSTFYKTDSISGDKLTAVILRNTSMCSIESAENLIITATAANTDCYIYVPADLLDEYKADNVWSTVADKFRAIEDYPTVVNYKCEVSEIE